MFSLRVFLLFIISVICSGCIGPGTVSELQTKNVSGFFPKLKGNDLMGNERSFPKVFDQGLNWVVVAFKRHHQADVDSWFSAYQAYYQNKPKKPLFYELPVIDSRHFLSRLWLNNAMYYGIDDEEALKRTIVIYTSLSDFLKIMNMDEKDVYCLLIDKKGKILAKIKGKPNNEKMKRLVALPT
jgi:hypothetical protein